MNIAVRDVSLPRLIDRASQALLAARSSAEVLEARDMASMAYTIAKAASRIAKAKRAHDDLIAAAHRAQADALEIEAGAKRRLADEYDAAQERGDVARHGQRPSKREGVATVADIGLTYKGINEARRMRDAEEQEPGITRRALDAMLQQGKPPSRAELRRAVIEDDDEDEDDISTVTPSEKRVAFMVFSNEAMLLAKYDGPIDEEVLAAARAAASAWCRLVETMENTK